MSGGKSEGQIIENSGTDNSLSPQDSQINFAVLSIEKLRNYRHSVLDLLPAEIQPGIIPQAIDLKQSQGQSYVLSVDWKKVSPGLTEEHGDENLFGHESPNWSSPDIAFLRT